MREVYLNRGEISMRHSLYSQFQARRRRSSRLPRFHSRSHGYQIAFKPRGRTFAFASEAFFSGPFLPFSIVLGAASPGEASSNGEDYIAAIIEPSALPGHSSGLPSCCTFRGGAGPSVNSRLFFSSPFSKEGLLCATF